MDVMSKLADNSYDLAICDPPYGIETEISTGGGSHTKSAVKFHQLYSENGKTWDVKPPAEYFAELRRVSKNQIICGGNYFADMMPASRGWAIWDKVTDGVTCVNPELFYTSFHKACKIFRRPQGLNNGFLNKEGSNIHPTQKPIELYEWLLREYAAPGQRILDTHMGSGSSVIAAVRGGFEMLACEIDPQYFAASVSRIGRQLQQQTFAMTPNAALCEGAKENDEKH
jgi:site-specific DNA-methyltransferase (adenine-specific)